MRFGVVGISYRQAPIEVRDQAAFSDSKKIEFYDALTRQGIDQAVVLSTCNRSEVYYIASSEQESVAIKEQYLTECGAPSLVEYLFEKQEEEAMEYLFSVAAGLGDNKRNAAIGILIRRMHGQDSASRFGPFHGGVPVEARQIAPYFFVFALRIRQHGKQGAAAFRRQDKG